MLTAGINGFGRFGLHLLKYWLDRSEEANFSIRFINDDTLGIDTAAELIRTDPKIQIGKKYKISHNKDSLTFVSASGVKNTIAYSNLPQSKIEWVGEPDIFMECSGKSPNAESLRPLCKGNTRMVLVSATCWNADQTLIYGFNHGDYSQESRVISYGSCTVNAYVPLASYLNLKYGVLNGDVNVIHNIQAYKLKDPKNYTLVRKFCTLEKSGPMLLSFLNKKNFIVNYTVVPYEGVSTIDFRFEFESQPGEKEFLNDFQHAITDGPLLNLYGMDDTDRGPEVHACTPFSTVFIKNGVKHAGGSVYLQAYFDNENSVNRYYDLSQYLADKIAT